MAYIGLIVTIILLINAYSDNKYYKKENEELKRKIRSLSGQDVELKEKPAQIENTALNQNKIEKVENVKQEKIEKQIIEEKKKTPKNTEGIKNKFILMTGAILIVLAAIVFLTSTWETIPNVIKTTVILLLAGVFLGASKIAKDVFKLEETANTFLYIALAYIPISLFSISIFGLLGDYLSIYGAGKNLYFFICSGILSVIYYMVGEKKKQVVLFNASLVMQILSVIFITQYIKKDLIVTMIGISIYNIALMYLKNNNLKDKLNIINIYNIFYTYLTLTVGTIYAFADATIMVIILNLLVVFSLFIDCKVQENVLNKIALLYQILICILSILNFNNNILNISIRHLVFSIFVIGLYCIGLLSEKKEWKEISTYVYTIAMWIVYLFSIFYGNNTLILKNYIILAIINIMNVINFMELKERQNIFIHVIPISLYLLEANIISTFKLELIWLVYMSIPILIISVLNLFKEKKFNTILQIYANVIIGISIFLNFMVLQSTLLFSSEYLTKYNEIIDNVILYIAIIIAYVIGYIKNKNIEIYKIIVYVFLNILIYSILHRFRLEKFTICTLVISTLSIELIEWKFKKLNTIFSNIYLLVSYILGFIFLNLGEKITILSFSSILVLGYFFNRFIDRNKWNDKAKIIPFLAVIPSIYFSDWAAIEKINLMIPASFILLIITSIMSIKEKKINIYTLLSGIYVLCMLSFDLSVYVVIITALAVAGIHYTMMEKGKAIFEIAIYILSLILYNNIYEDLSEIYIGISTVTALKYLGYIVFVGLITRNILKKSNINIYKVVEYIAFAILYLFAISDYTSQLDGMAFVSLLLIITIISYINKYGPIFFTTTIAIIMNVFLLTREFWFSVPWWIYMLTIGSILIIFAIKNEINENKQKEIFKNKVKKLKEYLDM